jgi:hypothetical protein
MEVIREYGPQAGQLVERERRARMGLRHELESDARADQARVSQLLDELIIINRERMLLLEKEQRRLAVFMTPVQRARWQAFQEQIFRGIEQMTSQRDGRGGQPRVDSLGGRGGRAGGGGRGGLAAPPPAAKLPPPIR